MEVRLEYGEELHVLAETAADKNDYMKIVCTKEKGELKVTSKKR